MLDKTLRVGKGSHGVRKTLEEVLAEDLDANDDQDKAAGDLDFLFK